MKNITQRPLLLIAAALLLLASCKIDKPDFSGYHVDSTGTAGNTSGDTYQPINKGTFWKYNDMLNGIGDTVTVTMTDQVSVINGRKYYAGISTDKNGSIPVDTGYISRDNHYYTSLSTTDGIVVELYYLNDTTAVGHGWNVPINPTGSILGVPGRFVGTIVEKNISKTVGGKAFKNVIHSKVLLQYDYGQGAGYTTEITYDIYVAKNVGIIETDSNGDNVVGVETIIDYAIK